MILGDTCTRGCRFCGVGHGNPLPVDPQEPERVAEGALQVLRDLRRAECDMLTLGQYLQPTDRQLPVARYVSPDEFRSHRDRAEEMGFRGVTAGPLVRSSYQAGNLCNDMF